VKKIMFHLGNEVGFFFACADLEYFKFTLKRSTSDLFGIMGGGGDATGLAGAFAKDYWYIVLIFLCCVALAEFGYRRAARLRNTAPLPLVRALVWRGVAGGLIALFARGGLQLMPLGVMNAGDYAPPAYFPVVLNTPFTMMMSLGKPVVEEKHYMADVEVDKLWPVVHNYADTMSIRLRTPMPPNVVVIILESFSAAYSGKLTSSEGYMPFLDSLMGQSLWFSHAYANGRRSIDGIPAVTASIPELMDEAFITSSYAQTPFTSLPNVLTTKGYHTSFFHGGRNGTMGFDGFAKSAGFQRYVGLNEYPDKSQYDGSWGVWDRPFLQFFAQELNKEEQPFMSCLFTLSSHHPYKLPAEEAARFPAGTQKIHRSLRYTDDALREFFATARTMPWFERTLFVITADHTADLERNGQHYSEATDYWIPLFYYMPAAVAPKQNDRVTQQVDILPTVCDLVGYDRSFFSFGCSALRDERAPMMVTHTTGSYLAVDEQGVLRFDGEQVPAPPVNKTQVPDTRDKEAVLKAAIQQFNKHLLHNELVVR
jgi:phosphoglycerol transferase MdoB-like AlkP superfamily enzyme